MPGSTTPDGIAYPVVGDKMGKLAPWFASLASSVQTALDALRADAVRPVVPAPKSAIHGAAVAISATAWADTPSIPAITLTLERPCWVLITHAAWMVSTSGDTRYSSAVSGATTLSETQLEVGGPASGWGQVLFADSTTGTRQSSGSRVVRLNAGTNTIKARAYRSGGGTHAANYPTLQVSPLYWA